MISVKKIISIAAVAALSVSLFAQTSMTNTATAGLFSTDVDNYLDVNSWSEVKPEKFFAYFGMRSGNYDLGFAKNFKDCYWGTYFSGNLGTSTSTKTTSGDSTSINNTTSSPTYFNFNNIIGLGNLGIGVNFYYNDHTKSYTKQNSGASTRKDDSSWTINVKAGLKEYKFNKYLLSPNAFVTFRMNGNTGAKTVSKASSDADAVTTDTRNKEIELGAATDILLGNGKAFEYGNCCRRCRNYRTGC